MVNLHQLLRILVENNGSDLHITTNTAPQIRVDGKLKPLEFPPLNQIETKLAIRLTDAQKHKFEEENELDLSFGVKGLSRFRVMHSLSVGPWPAYSGLFPTGF